MATGNLLGEYQLPRSAGVFEKTSKKKTPGWPFLWRLCLAPSSFQIIFEGICEGISMNIINGANILGKIINGVVGISRECV